MHTCIQVVLLRQTVSLPRLEPGARFEVAFPPSAVPSPRLWSDEAPHLYCLLLVLRHASPAAERLV